MTENDGMHRSMSRQRQIVDVLLVYLLLFVSGSWRYNLSPNTLLVAAFTASIVAWYLFSDRKINDRFVLYVIVFLGFLFSLTIYTEGSQSVSSTISATMKLVLAYLIIKTVGERFVDTYVKVLVFLAGFSLFGYLTDTFNLFDGIIQKLPQLGEIGYEGFLYVYRFPWHIDRNNSIFFEPGAYQAFLNSALFILFFVRTGLDIKTTRIYIAILVVTLATTLSTTGFLIFMMMAPLALIRTKVLSLSGKIKLVGLVAAIVVIFSAKFYYTFVEKIDEYLTEAESEFNPNAQSRSAHAMNDLKVFRKHPFGLGTNKYREEFSVAGRVPLELVTSSNGITKTLAVFGLPYSVFIFGSYYLALKRLLNEHLLAAVAFIMFLTFLAGEAFYIMSPISFAIIASAFVVGRNAARASEPQPA